MKSQNWDYKFAQEQVARCMAVQKVQEEMETLQSNFKAALEIAKEQQNSFKEQLEKKKQEKLVVITAPREEMK
jgi:flagellar motility protein MotE (MotC chaperone)